ncbi:MULTISPECIES: PTS sugar transporter subunit IIA [unclassified Thermoactinomyces]|jgi:galactitol PTS system EIIA component|uniref:PTS sugar transporter subunit IIA n=1 Tax=unclassified Thermoactinomyces TaxID=2634588 RepID=UPI0018DB2361|nr:MULTISPECIES: PTS sugar transporter subunit IIA [unclassified Thermoactinomyces]MBH8599633.1 PTS sugar transporter subunit IIA [Thermoactinomyces sp. CICC 10523]MBH8605957.1 PTS sugar transporter subunit IIA [Thermoactinomyces sp. CICC 10522]MBH8608836.1 PTS sugar transporter subunit IIA [Thermoactinomyces sp. CICC 10521]
MSELYFDESVILLDVEGDSKEEILEVVAQNLVDNGLVKESFIPAIIKREKEFATGLPIAGVSVAIPHTDVEHVIRKSISVAVLKKPVDFVIMGDDSETTPVQLIFMLAMDEAHSQLLLLQKLMQLFQDEEVLKFLVNQKNKTEIKSTLEEKLNLVEGDGE